MSSDVANSRITVIDLANGNDGLLVCPGGLRRNGIVMAFRKDLTMNEKQ
ncbi:MAG: hypothetical protein ACOC9B_05065 [Chloroflexota bacterium]